MMLISICKGAQYGQIMVTLPKWIQKWKKINNNNNKNNNNDNDKNNNNNDKNNTNINNNNDIGIRLQKS